MEQKPSIGRVVHYWTISLAKSRALPAIITAVHDERHVDLEVFGSPEKRLLLEGVELADEPTEGQWSWPPRV